MSATPSSPLRTVRELAGRAFGGPVALLDRVNIWTTIGFSLLVGDRRPYYYVLGYPKTGTNWVCNMLAGYLGIPVHEFWKSRLPHFSPAVMHMHRFLPFEGAVRRTLYVMRDGRDVAVSDYHHRMRDRSGDPALAAELERYLGSHYDPRDISTNLPAFIRYLIERRMASTDYVTHLDLGLSRPYVRLRYEDLLEATQATLGAALEPLLGRPVDSVRLAEAVAAERFENVTGRNAGAEDAGAFVRKGVSGDWRRVFTREAAETYDAYAGEVLIRAGYEPDHAWVESC